MSIRIDGTNTAANPGITGADADTGLQFGTDEVSIVTGGTDRVVTGTDIVFKNASGTERMRLASDGLISTTNHAECLAFASGQTYSGGDGATHTGGVNTFNYNRGGFTLSSNKLIVPKAGIYRCTFGFESQITNSAYAIRAMKICPKINGTLYSSYSSHWNNCTNSGYSSNIHFNFKNNYYLNLSANDQLDVELQVYNGGPRSESFTSWIQMFYIG